MQKSQWEIDFYPFAIISSRSFVILYSSGKYHHFSTTIILGFEGSFPFPMRADLNNYRLFSFNQNLTFDFNLFLKIAFNLFFYVFACFFLLFLSAVHKRNFKYKIFRYYLMYFRELKILSKNSKFPHKLGLSSI